MITSRAGAAGGNETWIKFMKLAEDARIRNSGLTTNVKKSALNASPAFPGLPLPHIKSTKNAGDAFTASTPDVKKRILGGQFDSYA